MSLINSIERHAYAPELNKVWLSRATQPLKAPGVRSIAEARLELFPKPRPRVMCEVSTHYPPELKWLERRYVGSVRDRVAALQFANQKRAVLAQGGTVKVRTWLAA